jgi:hypothetical protein
MRLINADDLIERINVVIEHGLADPDGLHPLSAEVVLETINVIPSAQPEIVRCKDCKYAEYIDDVQTLWCTECGQGRTVAPNDFCSYAERREVTT